LLKPHFQVRQHAAVTPAELHVVRTVGKSATAIVQVRSVS
jgi:hypothetical protein